MLRQDIEQQIKEALKAGNREVLDTLRFLFSAIKNAEIDWKREATDEDVVAVVQKQVKQHRESIEAFQKAGRPELAAKEESELNILVKYLPQQMSEDELRGIVTEIINGLSDDDKKNFGKAMGAVMARVKGKADGNTVGRIVGVVRAQPVNVTGIARNTPAR